MLRLCFLRFHVSGGGGKPLNPTVSVSCSVVFSVLFSINHFVPNTLKLDL